LKIWEKIKDLDSSLSFKSYLFTIALNTNKNRYRKKLQAEKYKQNLALELNINQT
jgi:DNA-directed RNA polymerase specialized sigma24 family protein